MPRGSASAASSSSRISCSPASWSNASTRRATPWRALFPDIEFVKAPYLRDHPVVLDAFCERVAELGRGPAGDELPALQIPHADHRLRSRCRGAAGGPSSSRPRDRHRRRTRSTIIRTSRPPSRQVMFDSFHHGRLERGECAAHRPRQHLALPARCPTAKPLPTRRPATRRKALLGQLAWRRRARGERVLLGFDFPFGYPAGFAARLGLPGPPWRAVWDEIAGLVEDDQNNRNNRFDVAAAIQPPDLGRRVSVLGLPARPRHAHFSGQASSPPRQRRARRAPAGRLLHSERAAVLEIARRRLGRRPSADRHPGGAGVARRPALAPMRRRSGRSRPGCARPKRRDRDGRGLPVAVGGETGAGRDQGQRPGARRRSIFSPRATAPASLPLFSSAIRR